MAVSDVGGGAEEHRRRGVAVPAILGICYLAVAVGNLALPTTVRSAALLYYLIVTLGTIVAFAVCHLRRLVQSPGRTLLLLALFVTLVPGALLATHTTYSEAKLQGLVIAAVVLATPLCLGLDTTRTLAVVTIGMGVVAVVYSVLLLVLGGASDTGRVSAFGLNPIGIGRLTAVGAVVAFAFLMSRGLGRWWTNVLALAVIALCMSASITTGSRGPVLAAVVAWAVMLVALVAGRRLSFWWLIALVAAAAAVYGLLAGDGSGGLDRLQEGGDSGRSGLYDDTLRLIVAHPVGIGWGNLPGYLPQDALDDSGVLYPHNLFLEVAVEGGWLALVAVTVVIVIVCVRAFALARRSSSIWPLILLGSFAFAFVNAQFSSDIVGNRMLWVTLGFAIALIGRRSTKGGPGGGAPRPSLPHLDSNQEPIG